MIVAPEVFLNPDALSEYLEVVIAAQDPARAGPLFNVSYALGIVHVAAILGMHHYPDLDDASRARILDAYSSSIARAIIVAFNRRGVIGSIDRRLVRMAATDTVDE